MHKKHPFLPLLQCLTLALVTAVMVSCGDDLPSHGKEEPVVVNTNSNANLMAREFMKASENKQVDLQQVAMGLEIPRLRGGARDMFIAHYAGTTLNYCVEYDCDLKASLWTAFKWYNGVSSAEPGQGVSRRDNFMEDPLIPSMYQSTLAMHRSNGYDRGHMLASEDRKTTQLMNDQTFYLSNIHPQNRTLNQRGIWYNLEIKIREYDKKKTATNPNVRDTLYVVKGGTIAPGQYFLTSKNLAVPTHFFIAILSYNKDDPSQGGYKTIGFWIPHDAITGSNYKEYAVSIDQLEAYTGIDFFCNLPDVIENLVERNLVLSAWNIR